MAVNKKEMAAGLASAVALISGAQVANAADVDAGPGGHDWSGLYLGVGAGYQFGDVPVSLTDDYNMDGDIAFGAFIGVNHQFDNGIVVGAEIAAQTGDDGDGHDGYDYGVDYTIDSKFKLGMALGAEDQVLAYVFAGPSIQNLDAGYSTYDYEYTSWSVNFGVGAEWMLTEQFSIGAELMGRAPVDEYQWTDHDHNAGINGQATLRAAFHF
jgi:opacity protein-like surface antigen